MKSIAAGPLSWHPGTALRENTSQKPPIQKIGERLAKYRTFHFSPCLQISSFLPLCLVFSRKKRWSRFLRRYSFLSRQIFSRIVSSDYFSSFLWGGKCQKNAAPGKSPAKSSKMYTTKIPDTFLQRGWAISCAQNQRLIFRIQVGSRKLAQNFRSASLKKGTSGRVECSEAQP